MGLISLARALFLLNYICTYTKINFLLFCFFWEGGYLYREGRTDDTSIMGSFNIIMFVLLIGWGGIISMVLGLYSSGMIDIVNQMISQGILSVDTVNTVTAIAAIILASPVIFLIGSMLWALSQSINKKEDQI